MDSQNKTQMWYVGETLRQIPDVRDCNSATFEGKEPRVEVAQTNRKAAIRRASKPPNLTDWKRLIHCLG